jgi:hypothetical protein
MPSWIELRLGCQGLFRLALFDRSFIGYFDRSRSGVLRSFGLFPLLLPIVLWQVWLSISPPPSLVAFVLGKTVASAFNWVLFPFLILAAGRLLERENEAPGAIALYNWTNVLWVMLQIPPTLAVVLGVSTDIAQMLGLALLLASLVIEGFMFAVVLRIAPWHAAVLTILDLLLSALLIWPLGDWLACLTPGVS